MTSKISSVTIRRLSILLVIALVTLGFNTLAGNPKFPAGYPPDPLSNIPWSAGYGGVADIESAFNNARAGENSQLGTNMPMLNMPTQTAWDAKSNGEKALFLINDERAARSVHLLHGVESNVTNVAQTYAQYLMDNDVFGHYEDGRSPIERLNANAVIGNCHDFLGVVENIAVFATTGSSIPLPVEQSVYNWNYDDSGSSWGHRHTILWYPYAENGGPPDREGFLGIGRANGGPFQGNFSRSYPFAEIIVMNLIDPCASWNYNVPGPFTNHLFLPLTLN